MTISDLIQLLAQSAANSTLGINTPIVLSVNLSLSPALETELVDDGEGCELIIRDNSLTEYGEIRTVPKGWYKVDAPEIDADGFERI